MKRNRTARTFAVLALITAIATPALAGGYTSTRRSYGTRSYSSTPRGVIGGRAVMTDYYRPYRHRSYGYWSRYRRGDTTVIIIERNQGTGRWR